MKILSNTELRRTAVISIVSMAVSLLLTVAPPLATGALAADCDPTTTTFVGGGIADPTSATFGNLGENYTELRFTSVGACDWTVPANVTSIDIALVGGGGGGGSGSRAGGGGAGELAYKTSFAVTPGASIDVSVGAGGAGGVDATSAAASGVSTTFGSAVALGGGRGAGNVGVTAETGGSSGGGRGYSTAVSAIASTANADALSFTRLVNNGGGSDGSSYGAGGGGAGGAAFATATTYSADPSTQPDGGASFTVFGHELAGGGSGWTGGTYNSVGGGTVGGSNFPTRTPTANTGSGGGAGSTPAGASAGADGVVILRYVTPSVTQTSTPTPTTTPTSAPSESPSAALASTGSDGPGSSIGLSISVLLIILGLAALFTRRHIWILSRK